MNIIERVQAILLKPKDTWVTIAQETADIKDIYTNYLVYLAAIPAIAGFIGLSLVGVGGFGMSFRVPIIAGLANMVVGYVLSLVMVYVLALIAKALAPAFQGEANLPDAFKLVAYGSTAGLIGGIFSLLPALSVLGLLTALYSIYLIYTGVPVLMKIPPEKAVGYTAVLIICGIGAALVVGGVSALFTSSGGGGFTRPVGVGPGSPTGPAAIKVPGTEVVLDTAKMEAASRKMEQAQAQDDSAAAGKAMGEMMGAMAGGQGGKPFSPDLLQGFVPDKLAGMGRSSIEARSDSAMGMNFSSVTAEFQQDSRRLEVKLQDLGAVPGLMMAMGAWTSSTVNRETAEEVEHVFKRDNIAYKEEYRKDGSSASLSMMLPNGIMLEVQGDQMPMDAVRSAANSLDPARLTSLKRAP